MKNIWTNGCYDILHIGHIKLFEKAKSLGDYLIVGIDSDTRVRQLKGNNKPINCQEHRKQMLESIKFIDQVIVFNTEKELSELIRNSSIDTIIVGDDYKDKMVVGCEFAKQTFFFPKIPNISSSIIYGSISKSTT
jgi:D-beta-D-heptose 7-phosphate kinase/D-beta-D-heptose 1-phosphate adenosyltransferase